MTFWISCSLWLFMMSPLPFSFEGQPDEPKPSRWVARPSAMYDHATLNLLTEFGVWPHQGKPGLRHRLALWLTQIGRVDQ